MEKRRYIHEKNRLFLGNPGLFTMSWCGLVHALEEDVVVGLARVHKDGKWGYIAPSGAVVIDPQWEDAGLFFEGLANVQKDGQWGFINATGTVVIKPQWDGAFPFSDGLARARKGEKWGFIDAAGKVISEPQWDEADPFSFY